MHGPMAAAMRSGRAPCSLHQRDRAFEHARERAFPAGVRGGDDAGGFVGEQHRARNRR